MIIYIVNYVGWFAVLDLLVCDFAFVLFSLPVTAALRCVRLSLLNELISFDLFSLFCSVPISILFSFLFVRDR